MVTSETSREIDSVLEELDELEVKHRYEVIDDSFRTVSRTMFLRDKVTELLNEGKTIRLYDSHGDKYYRWAQANGWRLNRRTFDNFTIMWLDKE